MVACTSSGTVAYSHLVMGATVMPRTGAGPSGRRPRAWSGGLLVRLGRVSAQQPAAPGRTPGPTRFHVVTGKGGTGKTTVAAALALALAAEGRSGPCWSRSRGGRASPSSSRPRRCPTRSARSPSAPGGGEVYALAIDAELALLDYLEMFYKLGRAGRALKKLGAIDFATTIAPGLRDVLLTGKACEAVRRKDKAGGSRLRRGGAGRAADRPHHPLPQRERRGGRAGQGRPDTQSGAGGHAGAEVRGDRGAPGDAAGGDAGPGDGGRRRRAARRRAAGRRGGRQHGAAARCWTRTRYGVRRTAGSAPRWPGRCRRPGLGGARRGGLAERLVDPLLEQAREHAGAGRAGAASSGPSSRRWACRRTSCRCWATGWTSAGCTGWRTRCAGKGCADGMGPTPLLRIDPLLDDPGPGSSSAAAPAGSARPRPRRRWGCARPSAAGRWWC